MEKLTYLDTHAVVWLYAGDMGLFPSHSLQLLAEKPFAISPAVLLELQYLWEVGRIKVDAEKIFKSLEKSIGLKLCRLEFHKIILASLKESWTRDPFDRLITAQASIAHAALITKDETILNHYPKAIWK